MCSLKPNPCSAGDLRISISAAQRAYGKNPSQGGGVLWRWYFEWRGFTLIMGIIPCHSPWARRHHAMPLTRTHPGWGLTPMGSMANPLAGPGLDLRWTCGLILENETRSKKPPEILFLQIREKHSVPSHPSCLGYVRMQCFMSQLGGGRGKGLKQEEKALGIRDLLSRCLPKPNSISPETALPPSQDENSHF